MTPIKIFFRWEQGETRRLVRARIWKRDDWRPHMRVSWRKRKYWLSLQRGPAPQVYRVQFLDWIVEWRVMEPRDGKLQD